jgi:hypothetical protein
MECQAATLHAWGGCGGECGGLGGVGISGGGIGGGVGKSGCGWGGCGVGGVGSWPGGIVDSSLRLRTVRRPRAVLIP